MTKRLYRKLYFLAPIATQWLIRIIIKILFSFHNTLKVEGLSSLDKCDGPLIFASNHVSEWDGPFVRTVMSMKSRFGPMFYVGMDKEFYRIKNFGIRGYLYGSPVFKLFGAYPIYYGLKNYVESMRNHIRIIRDGGSVTIFPEGRRSKNGKILEFKTGVIALSNYTDVSIVPVFIEDINIPTSKCFLKNKRKVLIKFGTPYNVNINSNLSGVGLLEEYKIEAIKLQKMVADLSK